MFDVDRNHTDVRLSMSLMPPDLTEFKKKERSIMSTGDILSPRKQAVMDRLRRRFERYRTHQLSCLPRYNLNLNGLIDQQHQETRNLRQRFLETKTKKANKKSEPKSKSGLSAGAGASGGGGGGVGGSGNDSSGAGGGGGGSGSGNSGSVNNSLGVNSVSSGSGSNSASNPSAGSGAGTGSQNSNTSLNGPQAKYKRTAEDSSSPLGCSRSTSGQKNNEANMNSGVSSGSNNKTNLGKSNLTQISAEFEFSSPGQQIQMNVKVTTVASNNIKTSGSPAPCTGPSVVSSNSGGGSCKSTTTTSVIDSNGESNGGNASVRAVSKTVANNNSSGGVEKSVDDDQDNKVGYQISCKQEPELDLGSCGVSMDCQGSGASHSFTDTLPNFDLNEDALNAFIEDWTSEDMSSMDLMNLEKFEDSVDPFRSDQNHLHGLTDPQQHHQVDKSGIDADNRNLGQLPPYPVGNQSGNVLPMFPVSSSSDSMTLNLLTNMNNPTMRPPSYTTQSSLGGLDFLAKETSPAAQTLKQMAEQHQQQRQQQHLSNIGLNTSSPFSSDFNQFGGAGNANSNSVSMDFLSSSSGSAGCFLPKNGSGPLFTFDSNPLNSAGVNKNSETLYRPTQRFHLPTHLQEAAKNQMNQQRTADTKNICPGNNSNGGGAGVNSGPTQSLLTGHCSPDLSCNSASTGSPLSFVGTKPLSHFGDSGQGNNNSPNNGTRQYVRTSGGPTQQQQQPQQQQLRTTGGASSPSSNVNLRQQRHHFMGMSSSQNGHHLQVSQGPHANVTSDQQPATMFSYGQPAPQGPPSGTGDHFQLSLSQSQAMTFSGANGTAIANSGSDRMVSVNQTTVVQLSSSGPPLNMMGHHSQLLRPATMQNQLDQPQQQQQQQQQQMMQMQMEKRKLNQQQVRNNHSGMTQFGARPPPPDYGTQMNLMSGPQQQQQQQSSPVMMPGVIGNQPGQLLMNNSSINSRGGNGPQPRLATALNVGGGGRLPMMNNRSGQQMNLGQIGMSGSGVPVNVNRTNMGMGGRFLGDDSRPPNVEIGPNGLTIGMRNNGENAVDWRQKINHNQHPSAKFQGADICQMAGVNPRFPGQILAEQRGMQSSNVDNVQMLSMQQQQQLNMINRLGSGVVSNCPSQSTLGSAAHHHHPHHQLNHHQQMSTMMQQQQNNSNSQQQSVNAHLMSQMSSSVVASAGSNFLSGDPSPGDFSDFFESGGFGATDLLNSLDLDIQNGNSGVHLL